MVADISFINYFAPIAAFIIVFAVVFAVLKSTKILLDNNSAIAFVSLLFAVLFVSMAGTMDFISVLTPWFVVLIVSFVFLLTLIGFSKSNLGDGVISDWAKKGFAWIFIILLGIAFIGSFFVVFSSKIVPYIPGPEYGLGADDRVLFFSDWLLSARVRGGIALLIVGAIAFWMLTKGASSGGGSSGGSSGGEKKPTNK